MCFAPFLIDIDTRKTTAQALSTSLTRRLVIRHEKLTWTPKSPCLDKIDDTSQGR